MIWNGTESSTLQVIHMLGDKVGNWSIDREKFSDYCEIAKRDGISHPRLGNVVLKVGDTLTSDMIKIV